MATVTLRLSPQRAHVRTARLVAAAMARRSGVPEELLDEVRLAVGEACSRAVQLHERHGIAEPVVLTLVDDDDRFEVVVYDTAPTALPAEAGPGGGPVGGQPAARELRGVTGGNGTRTGLAGIPDWEAPLEAGLGLALLDALVEDITVENAGKAGTQVRMSWPIDRPAAGGPPEADGGQPPPATRA